MLSSLAHILGPTAQMIDVKVLPPSEFFKMLGK
jgi:hypothetical protein